MATPWSAIIPLCLHLSSSQGVKEVTLLGQNVNSYRDTSEEQFCSADPTQLSRGFRTVYRNKKGGLRFADLLDQVSNIDPDMRIRFTSPHPKDFPDEVRYTDTEPTIFSPGSSPCWLVVDINVKSLFLPWRHWTKWVDRVKSWPQMTITDLQLWKCTNVGSICTIS